jgi:hypothetical protein
VGTEGLSQARGTTPVRALGLASEASWACLLVVRALVALFQSPWKEGTVPTEHVTNSCLSLSGSGPEGMPSSSV